MEIKKKLEEGYLLGGIKYKEKCNYYFMPIAYWILNYIKYDPSYNPAKWSFVFRDNILLVNDENIDDYLKAIEEDIIYLELLEEDDDIPEFTFYVDFDSKIFVSSFPYVEIETYLPDENWKGVNDEPIKYLKSEKRS